VTFPPADSDDALDDADVDRGLVEDAPCSMCSSTKAAMVPGARRASARREGSPPTVGFRRES
jgi:hypothetical protein